MDHALDAILAARLEVSISGICAARRAIDEGLEIQALPGETDWLETQLHAIDAWTLIMKDALSQLIGEV